MNERFLYLGAFLCFVFFLFASGVTEALRERKKEKKEKSHSDIRLLANVLLTSNNLDVHPELQKELEALGSDLPTILKAGDFERKIPK